MHQEASVPSSVAASTSQEEENCLPATTTISIVTSEIELEQELELTPEDENNVELEVPYSDASGGLMEMGGGGNSNASYIHLSGSGSGSSGVATTSIMPDALPDTKDLIEELCPVCGDKVSGYHYGLLTCESCKGFFKRTVQNKKVYTCVAERSCHIDKTQRKRCPFCRFQKCLDVGMKLEAVRADRMRGGRNKFGPMYKRDRARKLQLMRQRQLAAQTLRAGGMLADGAIYTPTTSTGGGSGAVVTTTGQPGASPFVSVHIKQEIQIPQVSSLTSSPDSSPSPISVVLSGGHASLHAANHHNSHSNHHHHHSNHHHNNNNNNSTGPGGGGGGGGVANSGAGSNNNNHPSLHIVPGGGLPTTANQSSLLMTTTSSTTTTTGTTSSTSGSNGGDGSKLWTAANSTTTSPHSLSPKAFQFDAAAAGGSAGGGAGAGKSVVVSPLIRDFVSAIDDREWQNSLYGLLQSQTYNQCEVDLFELMCKVLDQNLFSQVDWARNSVFFKDLKVDDQMKLLQHSWSDMLVLDHMHQRMHNNLPDETTLHNGQKFDLLNLGLLGVPSLADHFNDITAKLQELKFDVSDYICIKFLLLLNPDVRGISNRKFVHEGYEQVQQALLEYTITCYQNIQDKFNKMLQLLPDIHSLATRGEEHLYMKHCNGGAPTQTLLMEMLHAKRK